ncbi:DoxX family protein [Flavobacterium aquidurense]|uniref:Oxidoreductase n=2 Tax=Flavobacterium TaxID=237 RepID=A0ABR6QBS3_9FLAO|nr:MULTISPECIES: DoxX family protein [Flavobacterium]MBB4801712.1 putative oxidoreductase [Flavobacterium nitrogenifigens]MBB6386670.1 putative oxidoreductase [Flavobacterium notoginsengisoli]
MKKIKSYYELAPLFLRVAIGIGFIVHGWAKISRGTGGFEKLLTLVGVPFAHLNAQFVPYLELLGGIAVLIGLYTRFISIPLLITMLVAMFTIHINYGFSSVNTIGLTEMGPKFGPPGYEINVIYIAGLLSLILTGGGQYSVDNFISNSKKKLNN